MTTTKTKQHNRTNRGKQMPFGTAILVRFERGALSEIARKINVDPSLVSRVARGLKTSERVRVAIVRYLLKRGGAPPSAYLVEHNARRFR